MQPEPTHSDFKNFLTDIVAELDAIQLFVEEFDELDQFDDYRTELLALDEQ